MSRRKTGIGIAVLFALALSAFSASSASAVGTTAHTCVKDPNGTLFGPHCLTTSTGDETKYRHDIVKNETTTGTATNANTASNTTAAASATLKATLAGVNTEVTCAEVHGEGTFENRETAGGEMYAHAEGQLHYTGCEVKAPAGKGCKVANGGTITTNLLTGTTQEQGMGAKIEPKEAGGKFVEIKIEGCSVEALNQTFPVTGSVKAEVNGATLTSKHATVTTDNTLKFGGQKAGLEGALTLKAHSKAGEETKPLSATTT